MKAIEARDLVRRFGDLIAVNGVTFDVEQGEIFGFLGPNGAGKTTTITMLCTLLRPTAGTARVAGYDVCTQPAAVRRSIGLVFQDPSLDEQLTAWENLRFHAMLYGMQRSDFERRAQELLAMVELADRTHDLVRTFSGGMKRRLEIVRGLLHVPRVLFLDEPTLGLDPQTRRHIWDYIFRLREKENVTIFLTTHYMEEAEHADRIAIIDHGRIIALDTPENLKATVGGDVIHVHTSDPTRAVERLRTRLQVEPRVVDGVVMVELPQGERMVPQVVQVLSNGDPPLEVQSISLRRPTLEDVFIKLTGRAIRDEEADSMARMRMAVRSRRRH